MKNILVAILVLAVGSVNAQVRSTMNFNAGWKFYLGNDSMAKEMAYDDSKWRKLSLPHDWSIESDFIKDALATPEGGSLPGGIGWYRKEFALPATAKDKIVSIEFGGVYQNSEVWINGHYLGKRPNGYISFSYELTDYLLQSPQKNIIAVKVDNSQQPNSRWYTGSGIYRNVKLLINNRFSFTDRFPTFIHTESVDKNSAVVKITAELVNRQESRPQKGTVKMEIFNKQGILISLKENNFENAVEGYTNSLFTDTLQKVIFWDVDNPNLYKAKLTLYTGGEKVDEITIPFGVRSTHFDKDKGFFLNNKPLKIQGVCMHHDLGALGSAFNISAAKRQLKILKDMGCNAIRFAHNPPATEMLDLCDQMGFLVIDEAFDMWYKKKNKYDYHKDFKDWYKRDLEAIVYRDRNHPSVIMWSVGNEIREQFDSTGITITRELVDIVKALDPTRPVTSAMTETKPKYNFIAKSNALDVFGFNYREYDYDSLPYRFPNQKFIASESASSIATRGVYYFPSDSIRTWPMDYKHQPDFDGGNADFTGPAFDNTKAYWGNTHEKSWLAVKRNPHMAGTFIWSGFDYIGEPLPYPKFPARSSYFGVIDLAGFPKDVYYMYQSEWTKKNVLHLFPQRASKQNPIHHFM
jgi:beta-galactosidase